MNLDDRQLLERIAAADELSAAERNALQQTAAPAAPLQRAMLGRVYATAAQRRPEVHKEYRMQWIGRLIEGRSWYAQLGVGLAVIAMVALAATLIAVFGGPQSPSYAATDGYVLKYSGTLTVDESELKDIAGQVQSEVKRIKEEYAKTDPSVLEEKNVVIRVEARKDSDDGPLTWEIVLGLIGDNQGLLDALQEGLTGVAGLGTPEVLPNTWFGPDGADFDGDGINLTIGMDNGERQFTFPKSASEEEIEDTLRQWMNEQHPGEECEVDVTITRDGEQVQVGVEIKCPDHKEPAGAAAD